MTRSPALDAAAIRRVIGERRLGDWVITDRSRQRWSIAQAAGQERRRADEVAEVSVLVRRDLPSGRGTGVASTQDRTTPPRSLVGQAVTRAEAAIEAPWVTPPAAAVTKVALFDVGLEVEAIAKRITSDAAAAGMDTPALEVAVSYDDITLVSAQGFSLTWRESIVEVDATFERDQRRTTMRRRARRLAELDVSAGVAEAAIVLRRAPTAAAPTTPVYLELTIDAMLGEDDLGMWRAVTSQCDATAARRGLTRLAPGAHLGVADPPLEVWSDGSLPYGLRSAPLGAEAEAVRRFPIVASGKLGSLGLGPREAAVRKLQPNGGVRNLVVNPGADAPAPSDAPVLIVHRLARLTVDPLTGFAEASLGYARDRDGKAISRGAFSLDLARALATATRSAELVHRGAYFGPRWLRIGPIVLR